MYETQPCRAQIKIHQHYHLNENGLGNLSKMFNIEPQFKFKISITMLRSLHLSGVNALVKNSLVHFLTPGGQPDSLQVETPSGQEKKHIYYNPTMFEHSGTSQSG